MSYTQPPNNNIEVGDTVQVVRWCCSSGDDIMWMYSIAEEVTEPLVTICTKSLTMRKGPLVRVKLTKEGYVPIEYLRKVPPLTEEEKDTIKEEVPA